ncbi:hypothetical protein GQ600_2844 [Phytophthora cactorum]|nr:hypothetical protein GQ600_2844 [Phytophthora cactorum]
MATKWSKESTTLSFRSRRFPLRNVHGIEQSLPTDSSHKQSGDDRLGRMASEINSQETDIMFGYSTYRATWVKRLLMRQVQGCLPYMAITHHSRTSNANEYLGHVLLQHMLTAVLQGIRSLIGMEQTF